MGPHTLDRGITPLHFGDDRIVIVAHEPSPVANLPAGFGIEGSVVENDFALIPGMEFLRALPLVNDGENFAAFRTGLAIAFEPRARKLLVGGIGRLFGGAFPGCPSAFPLLGHRAVEAGLIKS
jgi:hypothetical protein